MFNLSDVTVGWLVGIAADSSPELRKRSPFPQLINQLIYFSLVLEEVAIAFLNCDRDSL